jgi:hypothetical protein
MNTEKKQWVTPTATEIEVNNGSIPTVIEISIFRSAS